MHPSDYTDTFFIVIVGVTLFYAVLSVISIILGDVLMSMVDPRISFSTKDR